MGDSLDDMIWLRKHREQEARERKAKNLASADTDGWQQFTPYHFRRSLSDGSFIDWWPSSRKFCHQRKSGRQTLKGPIKQGHPNTYVSHDPDLSWV